MFLEVVKAEYINDFKLKVDFNNGISKTIDLEDKLEGTVFEPLKNKDYFKTFTIKYNTIEWENGADFAPEFLFQIGINEQALK